MRHSIKISSRSKIYKSFNMDGYFLTWNASTSQWTPSGVLEPSSTVVKINGK